jgi:tetratricopeptide (TPR) repeat protein
VDPREESGQRADELRGRTAVLLFGREKLRWQRYDSPGTPDPWSNYIESYELTGFTKPDAQAFLRTDYAEFWKARAPEVVEKLHKHENVILEASDERESSSTYLPYYLRLAGEMIYEQGDHFVPEMLGHSPDEMQQRFIKYLRERSPEKFRAMRSLALALYFDDDLFDHLVRENYIHGIPVHGMVPVLLSNRCYVRRFESNGQVFYRFHRHMQQALLDDLDKNLDDVQVASQAMEAVLDYYAACAACSTPADFRAATHLPAYEHGMDILLTFVDRGWVPAERAAVWLNRYQDLFDNQVASDVQAHVMERVLNVFTKTFTADNAVVATTLNMLALLYAAQGRYKEAEPLCIRAMTIREKTSGPYSLDVAQSLNNLAGLYREQGKYETAEPLYVRALDISTKTLGDEHAVVAVGLSNLAELYQAEGRYKDAEQLYVRALSIQEKTLGGDDPAIFAVVNNLATLYSIQGRAREAEPLCVRALAIQEKSLGSDHPQFANILDTTASMLEAHGLHGIAAPLYVRALNIRKKALGPDHPDFATSLMNVAGLYTEQGLASEAEPLLVQALAIQENSLGGDHPSVAIGLNNLAEVYCWLGRYEEAESLYLRSLRIREEALGGDHRDVAVSLSHLSVLYSYQGRYEVAEPLCVRALTILEKALGEEHSELAGALDNYAELLSTTGREASASVLRDRAAAIRAKHRAARA